jgi:molecular chaperone DnaK (HSP70)
VTEVIQSRIGKLLWENMTLQIVLTVPAIWDHKAQELTRKAAEMAGLLVRSDTTLELVGEPEAAALAVFDELRSQKKRSLKVSHHPEPAKKSMLIV